MSVNKHSMLSSGESNKVSAPDEQGAQKRPNQGIDKQLWHLVVLQSNLHSVDRICSRAPILKSPGLHTISGHASSVEDITSSP